MPTVVTDIIGATGDYTTLQAWENAMTADLVAADEQWVGECQDQNFNAAANILTIAGHTTDATRNIVLTTNGTASFKDKAGVRSTALLYNASNGTNITCTTGYVELITIDDEYVTIEGLQISHTGSGGGEPVLDIQVANAEVCKCIIKSARIMIRCQVAAIVSNCLLQLNGGGTGVRATGGTSQVRNNTIVNVGAAAGIGLDTFYATIAAVNNALFNLTTVAVTGSGGAYTGSSHNASDAASVPGTSGVTSLTFADQFENTSTDFRALSTGDLQAGTPDATYAPDDITDTDRDNTTPWIGCWEVVAAGGTNPKGPLSNPFAGPFGGPI